MHEKCQEITEVKTLVKEMGKDIKSLEGLYKPVNRLTGTLIVIGIMVAIFLFIVKDTRSQVDNVDRRLTGQISELNTLINKDLKDLAVSTAELKQSNKRIYEDMGTINYNVLSIKDQLYSNKREEK